MWEMAIRLMEAAMDWVPLCMALVRAPQNGCRGQVMIPSAGSRFWPHGGHVGWPGIKHWMSIDKSTVCFILFSPHATSGIWILGGQVCFLRADVS